MGEMAKKDKFDAEGERAEEVGGLLAYGYCGEENDEEELAGGEKATKAEDGADAVEFDEFALRGHEGAVTGALDMEDVEGSLFELFQFAGCGFDEMPGLETHLLDEASDHGSLVEHLGGCERDRPVSYGGVARVPLGPQTTGGEEREAGHGLARLTSVHGVGGGFAEIWRKLSEGMGLEAAYEGTGWLSRALDAKGVVEEVDDLAGGVFHGYALLAKLPDGLAGPHHIAQAEVSEIVHDL